MHVSPLDQALEEYASSSTGITVTLRDGSVVEGRVKDYDGYVILLEGAPETMLYRHSILKLAASETKRTERPTERPAPKARAQAPQKPKKAPAQRPVLKETAETHGQLSPFGEEMLKWLKSQKGGE